jgi:tetratricopeptide (TPR) repeat protein
MSEPERSGRAEHERLRTAAAAAVQAGNLEEALALLDAAIEQALRCGDAELADRAWCNRAAIAINRGELEEPLPELRRILMANRSQEASFLAAYNIARIYELRKEHKKGLFYAQIARDRATALGNDEWLGAALNQMGNFQVADSHFAVAADSYRRSLALLPEASCEVRHTVGANLGYCALTEGQLQRGLALLYRSLRAARRSGWRRLEMIAHLDLCYGLMERRRLRLSWAHGTRGLAIAEEIGEPDPIKNGLYLLGEVAVMAGEPERGHGLFTDLQRRFYPDQPYLPDFLASVDVRRMINLRA